MLFRAPHSRPRTQQITPRGPCFRYLGNDAKRARRPGDFPRECHGRAPREWRKIRARVSDRERFVVVVIILAASRARVATAATPWSTTPLGGARTLVRASAAAAAPTADAPKPILLSEYAPPEYTYVSVFLEFDLGEEFTTVSNTCSVEPRVPPVSSGDSNGPLFLNGDVPSMDLVSVTIDGVVLTLDKEYTLSQKGMTIAKPPSKLFELKITTKLTPAENTELEGLYKTSGNFCTQCEAEGFRRITYFQDRPDVMSVFTTKITADKQKYPVLLSNGNLTRSGDCEDDAKKHFTTWNDPFPKPSYLFALVAGNLGCVNDTFTTMSGRTVQLKIYVEHHNLDKTEWAMVSLKKSMKWDEDVFGLEYDLDLFNIVAVDDFNMGAMENKGLNIFNSAAILASNHRHGRGLRRHRRRGGARVLPQLDWQQGDVP